MIPTTQQLLQLKEKIKKLDEQRIRAEANLEQATARLNELGYNNVEEAEAALKEMEKAILEDEAKIAEDMDVLFDKYPELR